MHLLLLMLERVGLLIIVALLLSRIHSFRFILYKEYGWKEKLLLIFLFGGFGVISNYTGIVITGDHLMLSQVWQDELAEESAIANTRIMGVAIGGLFGGPLVGFGAGLIAGLHRLTLGGFTAVACGISTILSGIVTGFIGKRFHRYTNKQLWVVVAIGILMECIQMGIILLVAKPFSAAWQLVQIISFPMIIVNGFGMLVFMFIFQTVLQEEERIRALQINKALYIADQTLPFFRKGLNVDSCKPVAEIILRFTNADAVAITDRQQVLAHASLAADHHITQKKLSTNLTKRVIEQGKIQKAYSAEQIECSNPQCPLQGAIVIPLQVHKKTIGTLKLYFTKISQMDRIEQELSEGLGKLISTQLELAEAEKQSKLLKDAEIKALQAQVHPHFLFNAINTISALCRTDVEKARYLLIQLATFFRQNLQGAKQTLIPLEKELEHVKAYLALEEARYPSKYQITYHIQSEVKKAYIPPFTIQPIVENAIQHAFSKLVPGQKGCVSIEAFVKNNHFVLVTTDNGQGIPREILTKLGNEEIQSLQGTGNAIYNMNQRIKEIYGDEATFLIESQLGKGTKVTIRIPLNTKKWRDQYADSIYR
jgi:two-component system sensor histidine kinase LytS